MSEKMVEMEGYILEKHVPGYGESKSDLTASAIDDLLNARDLIKAVMAMVNDGPELSVLERAKDSLDNAKTRIEMSLICASSIDFYRPGVFGKYIPELTRTFIAP